MLTSLYIHIPFCDHICTYCDFHKEMAKESKKERYIKALIQEIHHNKSLIQNVKTIYIGGGTPTSLDLPLLESLFRAIKDIVQLDGVIEYTIESNPNDYHEDLVILLKAYGINRVSLGVQTFNQEHLAFLERTHQKEDVNKAITLLKRHGINNINVDFIFSLVNQTMEQLSSDIDELLQLEVQHISYYSLILEEKSKLYYLLQQNRITMNSEDLEGQMYNLVRSKLQDSQFKHYEISNFAKEGYESVHNKTYWENKEYLGVGSGSHSRIESHRYYNPHNVSFYITEMEHGNYNLKVAYEYDALGDEMMLGLRLLKGIHIPTIEAKYSINLIEYYPQLQDFINQDILVIENEYLKFTNQGILLGNLVFEIFVEVL